MGKYPAKAWGWDPQTRDGSPHPALRATFPAERGSEISPSGASRHLPRGAGSDSGATFPAQGGSDQALLTVTAGGEVRAGAWPFSGPAHASVNWLL